MARYWPILAIAAAAIVALVLLLGGEEEGGARYGDEEIVGYDEQGNPILMTTEGRPRKKRAKPPRPTPEEMERREAERRLVLKVLFLHGLVVAHEGGTPIPNAQLWAEPTRTPCPRLPGTSWSALRDTEYRGRTESIFDTPIPLAARVALDPSHVAAGKDGRFRWEVLTFSVPGSGLYDVFVSAPKHVTAVVCKPATGSEVTVTLQKALQLPVRVTDIHGRPIEAAQLQIVPAEGTPAVPGHGGLGSSDKNGRAEIDGLLPGDVLLKAEHPAFMPQTIGPLDPASGDEIEVRLSPALRVKFEIRSDDGSAIKDPILAWETDGRPPLTGLTLLKATPNGPPTQPQAEVHTAPVRIPCNHRNVRFTLKADGFEPWSPEPEPLPVDGGERTVIVSLRRDTSLASLRIRFQDGEGKPISYLGLQSVPVIMRMDGMEMPSGIKLESGETLDFPSLPAGPYRISVSCRTYAPVDVDITVVAGEKNEATAHLTPTAKLRVHFSVLEDTTVRFRLVKDGRVLFAFPENATGATNASQARPLVVQGNEGTVFTGLPAGACTLEVTSPELVAASRVVHLRAGETSDMEMEVTRR